MTRPTYCRTWGKPVYRAGHSARLSGASRMACPHGMHDMRLHCLWLAGWHDADMEISA